ncbi:MAG: L-seryl-tRNA(Sec) selenium transferase [Candidatus Eremiobacteraeota bacterium]|nr:L-seryl-tRNA(Sec) selenium transferase [Candidatus Eremiobacteraeota bacterium]MDQ6933292.1 L-seryl-tRNA(Sec) selenium transferase [Candidatus Eremiobacteraeota bacterium]
MRQLPAMHRFLSNPGIAVFEAALGRVAVKRVIEAVMRDARAAILTETTSFETLLKQVARKLAQARTENLAPVINATGVILHTNLGRAPLAQSALKAMAQIGEGYSNVEYDLPAGSRGSRYTHVRTLLCDLTGAQDALIVNNCAAAVLLILDSFARGREVVVSRNQLIEIGGGFRLPDVLQRSHAHLIEVGTTNRVYLADFEHALTVNTGLLLRTHPSNYRIDGFVADVRPADFAALGKRAGIPTVEDLGSGALVDLARYGMPHERTVQEAVTDGIDLVAFSGDKLLGGPQAGIIVGKRSCIARLRSNALLRALRVDKVTLAALAATLQLYTGDLLEIPVFRMLATTVGELNARALTYKAELDGNGLQVAIKNTIAYVGAGTLPLAPIPSRGIALEIPGVGVEEMLRRLRALPIPIIARVEDECCILDLRSIAPSVDTEVRQTLRRLV